jgi:hypothetical protein
MRRLLFIVTMFILSALAADIDGTWKGTASGPNGTIERTFFSRQTAANSPEKPPAQ